METAESVPSQGTQDCCRQGLGDRGQAPASPESHKGFSEDTESLRLRTFIARELSRSV